MSGILTLTLPEYEVLLPISNKKVKYRPFVTREEKILLLALEDGSSEAIIRATDQIIKLCTFDICSIDNLNKVDAEFLFIQLRNKSIGECVDVNGICKECKGKTQLTLNFEQVKVNNKEFKNTYQLGDALWVTMKLPSLRESLNISSESEDLDAIAVSLETIIYKEASYNAAEYSLEDRKNFVGNLTQIQLAKLNEFFKSFPKLVYDIEYDCIHCKAKNQVHIEGLENFFV